MKIPPRPTTLNQDRVLERWLDRLASVAKVTLGSSQTTTSGTSVSWSIPAGIKQLTVSVSALSTNGTTGVNIQLSTSGAYITSGYTGVVTSVNNGANPNAAALSSGFAIGSGGSAANTSYGIATLALLDEATGTWACSWTLGVTNTLATYIGGGTIVLSGQVDGVRLISGNGTDTLDSGSTNIAYRF